MNTESTFEEQLERLKKVTRCRTQNALAEFLETSQSSISSICRKRKIPATVMLKLVEKKQINPEWIKTGNGDIYFGPEVSISPEMIAECIMVNPEKLSLIPTNLLILELDNRSAIATQEVISRIPSHFMLRELYDRSNDIQCAYETQKSKPAEANP